MYGEADRYNSIRVLVHKRMRRIAGLPRTLAVCRPLRCMYTAKELQLLQDKQLGQQSLLAVYMQKETYQEICVLARSLYGEISLEA